MLKPLRKFRSQKHPKGARKSDRAIAEHCGVSDRMVNKYREKLEVSANLSQIGEREVTRNGTTYTQDTTNIGSTAEAEEVAGSPNSPIPSTYSPIPRVLSESVYVDASGKCA